MGSQLRLAAAVTMPFLKGKAEERGSPARQHLRAPWLEASCAPEGSGHGGCYHRVRGDWWQIASRCWELGTEPGSSEAEGEEVRPRLPAQLVSALKLILFSFPAMFWVCCESPWLLIQPPAAPALRSHGG